LTTVKLRTAIALLLLFCILLCSCQATAENSALHNLQSEETEAAASKGASEHDYLIIPANAGSALISRARTLAVAISERTGIPCSVYFDDEDYLVRENARLLLVGNVRHALSQAHLHDLRRDDYLCVSEGGTLVLGGKSDTATVAAIDRFSKSLLPYVNAEILINADQHFLIRAEYALTEVTLNGFSLGDYRLVYPKNGSLFEKSLAYRLREKIADRCGFYLNVLSDDLVQDQARVIAIGNCFGNVPPTESAICADGSVITLCGTSSYSLCDAAYVLLNQLFANVESTTATLSLSAPVSVADDAPSLSALAGLLFERDAMSNVTAIANLSSAAQTHEPAMLPCSAVSQDLLSRHLQPSLSSYVCLSHNASDGRVLPFFYREDLLTLCEQTSEGSVHKMRLSIRGSGTNFTVLHASAETEADARAVLQAAHSESEPTLIFLVTPASVSLSAENTDTLRGPFVTEQDGLRLSVFMHLPQGFSDSSADTPASTDEPYRFTFTHPFFVS